MQVKLNRSDKSPGLALVSGFCISLPVSAIGIDNSTYHGTYSESSSSPAYINVSSSDVYCNMVYNNGSYIIAVNATAALIQQNQFYSEYSSYISHPDKLGTSATVVHSEVSVQGQYYAANPHINVSGISYYK